MGGGPAGLRGPCTAVVNYFADGMDAGRYARARPNIHATAIAKFRLFARMDEPFSVALDVGCGTGQSTVALAEIAERIVGTDPSADMLSSATPHPKVEYREAAAEDTPFADRQFDLVSAAQAFHWFDHDAFLAESHRVLRAHGWLLVYTSWFTGEMKDEPSFSDWFKGAYLTRYPTPPRNRAPITEELAREHRFGFRGEDQFSNEISMIIARFTDYLLSTTNVIAAVKRGSESFEDAAQWIRASLECFYGDDPERVFLFSGKIWYLQKPGE
jgi:SAM-dependent methyltransferase